MSLTPGTRLGPYEILSALGAGGMGEVYRATDTNLKRQVAIKVLPQAMADDPERLARFQREAEVLAALNHPNIAHLYGLEKTAGALALVMELVEGPTLADRIAQGPIPIVEALPIARQIAEALEAAHEQGIIHRDLKPANIKVREDGTVKVLDFGLAKLVEPPGVTQSGSQALATASPTITTPAMMTGVGVILGTAAYMSPEQASGKTIDKRADIWAFGVMLFEMLAGRRPFPGEEITDTLAFVITREPDWSVLPATTPPPIRALLKRCLEKDARERMRDIGDVRIDLKKVAGHPTDPVLDVARLTPRSGRGIAFAALAVLAVAVLTAIGTRLYVTRLATPTAARFFVLPPDKGIFQTAGNSPFAFAAISPDGRTLAFTARDGDGRVLLWLRSIDALTARPLQGTDGAQFPFWSTDSRSLGYFALGRLLRVDVAGGPPQTLCAAPQPRGGAWNRDGVIVFGGRLGSLERISSAGGQPQPVTQASSRPQDQRFPSFLPDQQHVLFYVNSSDPEQSGVNVLSLDSGESKRLTGADTGGVYARPGYLLFVRQGTLLAQPFDAGALRLGGDPFPIAERIESSIYTGVVTFSVSDTGTLAYGIGSPATATANSQLTWFDRQGRTILSSGPPANYKGIDLSPDGMRIVVHRHEGLGGGLWLLDASRNTNLLRFTFDDAQDSSSPVWSPDGARIVFASFRGGKWGLYAKPSNGAANDEMLMESDVPVSPMSWSPDGRFLVYRSNSAKTAFDLWALPLSGGSDDRKPVPLLNTTFNETHGQVSPDGKWLAYASDETGRQEIYVRPFPTGSGKWLISTAGGTWPRWRHDTRELFYFTLAGRGKLMSAEINVRGNAIEQATPKELFDPGVTVGTGHVSIEYLAYAVSADGQRFLVPRSVSPTNENAASTPIAVLLNWASSLNK